MPELVRSARSRIGSIAPKSSAMGEQPVGKWRGALLAAKNIVAAITRRVGGDGPVLLDPVALSGDRRVVMTGIWQQEMRENPYHRQGFKRLPQAA